MSIYIYRNNQQTGPFEEHAVLAWLRGGQLSGEDLACRAGENNWRPLKALFPMTHNVQPVRPTAQAQSHTPPRDESPQNKKGGGAKVLLFVLLGVGGVLLFGGVGIFMLIGSLAGGKTAPRDLTSNSSNVSNSGNLTSTLNEPRFKAMQDKADELVKLSPPVNLNPNALIRGKVAVVENGVTGRAEVQGFDAYNKEFNELDLNDYGLTRQRMATKPDEIDTLIQVLCQKGKSVGFYTSGKSSIAGAFANVCTVSIIDYRVPAVIAQKIFTNDKPNKEITTHRSASEHVLPAPAEIKDYAKSFPLEKLAASATEANVSRVGLPKFKAFVETAPELGRVLLPVSLSASPAVKGKVAVVEISDSGQFALKGFDFKGEDYVTYGTFGIEKERLAVRTDEIDTLIRVVCDKGDRITSTKGVAVYANKCQVSLVDFKASTVVAQKTFENRLWDREDFDAELYKDGYVVLMPFQEIEDYLKALPTS